MKKILENKVTIITGAGRGLGEAISYGMAEEGAIICPWDINEDDLKKVSVNLDKKYNRAGMYGVVDVTDEKMVEKEVKKIEEKFKRIDILVSNAGILKAYEVTEFPEDIWRKIIEVNLTGYFICTKYVAKVMKKQHSGVIIQINSKSGKKGSYKNSAYASSKFAGIGFTQSVALDLAEYGIRVNAVCPGNLLDSPLWVDSLYDEYSKKWGISKEEVRKKYIEQVPLKRGCSYQDVINVVVFLASDRASYMTGQAINVTGGQEMG